MQPVAQPTQSALLAREAGFADAVRRFGQTFVATSVVTIIAMAAPPTPGVGLGIRDKGGEPSSRLRYWPSMRNVHITMNLSPCFHPDGGNNLPRPRLHRAA